ncbi:hypothetical protein TNCT_614951 [Trichonephila clavata]|uniref:Uncharacterized protein n=1 Tax=Trichonephila clavata TaxID=2740835 RepID=A0A8X6FP43_TRICU|nr:hypothetical protein TNCT_614951 [Trichonephila clavata]
MSMLVTINGHTGSSIFLILIQSYKQEPKGCRSYPRSSCLSPHIWGRSSGRCHSPLNGSVASAPTPTHNHLQYFGVFRVGCSRKRRKKMWPLGKERCLKEESKSWNLPASLFEVFSNWN